MGKTSLIAKIFSFSLILVFTCVSVIGQKIPDKNRSVDLEIVKDSALTKGIYMSFKDFQQNNPSIQKDFKFGDKKAYYNAIPNTHLQKYYLYVETNTGYTRFKQKPWGVCDGKNVFILFQGKYLRLALDGKYCLFIVYARKATFTYAINYFSSLRDELSFVLDITNDERTELTIENTGEILEKEDAKLFHKFEKDTDKDHSLLNYITKVNNLYTSDVIQ